MTEPVYTRVASVSEIAVGEMRCVEVEDRELLICHVAEGFFAFDNVCTHADARPDAVAMRAEERVWTYAELRDESARVAQALIAEGVAPEDVTEERLAEHLCTAGLPEPDLIIRTGGEQRMSNFLIWQAAYSEYHFTDTYWPDFGERDIDLALAAFSARDRRFGGLSAEDGDG